MNIENALGFGPVYGSTACDNVLLVFLAFFIAVGVSACFVGAVTSSHPW
jgi:hypothetical protein